MPKIAVVGHRWPAVTSSAGQLLLSKSDFLYHKHMTTFLNYETHRYTWKKNGGMAFGIIEVLDSRKKLIK